MKIQFECVWRPIAMSATVLALIASPAANAAFVSYTSSSAFQAALSGGIVTIEDFEGAAVNTVIANGSTFNGLTYNFSGGIDGRIDNLYNHFDEKSLAVSRTPDFFLPDESISVAFDGPVTAFGIFFNVVLSPAGALFATTNLGDTAVSSDTYDLSTFQFVGLISDVAFNSVTFGANGTASSGFNVDNMILNRVPEPTTMALFGLALLAVRACQRRP